LQTVETPQRQKKLKRKRSIKCHKDVSTVVRDSISDIVLTPRSSDTEVIQQRVEEKKAKKKA